MTLGGKGFIDSCHPPEHKLTAISFLTDRCDIYGLKDTNKMKKNQYYKPNTT
jgi:hypothetical protein